VKKIFSILFALVLVVSLGLATAAPVLAGDIINVPGDYSTIYEALNMSSDGDTIMVAAGEYEAFVVYSKANINIISTEGATVTTAVYVSDLWGVNDAWVMATVDASTNINIEGINFDGTDLGEYDIYGIAYVDSTGSIADLTVANIYVNEAGAGVAIISDVGTSDLEITGCTISNISGNGIGIDVNGYTYDASLEAHFNNIVGNSYGVDKYGIGTADATNNWWGDKSGPSGEGPGTGDSVSDNVYFDPWLEAEVGAAKTETFTGGGTVDAKDEADTEVYVTGEGTATVTVAKYNDNPGGPPASGFITMGKYIDVNVPDTSGVSEIEIRLYYTDAEVEAAGIAEESLRLFGWNGTDWVQCSDSDVNTASTNGYSGYIWAIITDDTTPTLGDLEGHALGDGGTEGPSQPPGGGGCFIATAAYGTDTARQLDILREFRDEVLLPNSLGAKLVSLYYKTSPPIADFISQNDVLRTVVRMGFVEPIVKILTWTHGLWST
jgi:hypothetical protein